jgi:hypothetical protein
VGLIDISQSSLSDFVRCPTTPQNISTLSAGLIPKHVCQAPRRLLSTIAQRAEAYPFSARSLSSKNDGAVYGWMCSVGFDAA